MQVGCFGDVVFSVSSDKVMTFDDLKWEVTARYGVHEVHNGESLLEFTGVDTGSLSMTIVLTDELGVDPMTEIAQVLKYLREGYQDYVILGGHKYGTGLWALESAQVEGLHYGPSGKLRTAELEISFQPVGTAKGVT